MDELDEYVELFHEKCVQSIQKTLKELNYPYSLYGGIEFGLYYGLLGLKRFKFRYSETIDEKGVLQIERPSPWYAPSDYYYDWILPATKDNIRLVCDHGETILEKLPGAVKQEIEHKMYNEKKMKEKEKRFETACTCKIKKWLK